MVGYRVAVRKLRTLADACQHASGWPPDEPLLRAAYVFGEVLDGADPIDRLEVVIVLNLPPEQVRWAAHPRGVDWLIDALRLDKGGYRYYWRSRHDPVWNHHIRGPVRFWSVDGADEHVLAALAERRFDDLSRVPAEQAEERARVTVELDAALARLRDVHRNYWERDWRREHRGNHRYPENELWDAVEGYLDLLAAARPPSGPE